MNSGPSPRRISQMGAVFLFLVFACEVPVTESGQEKEQRLPTPVNLAVKSFDGKLEISWSPVGEASSYLVYCTPVVGSAAPTETAAVSSPCFLEGLDNGTEYAVWVVAVEGVLLSLPSVSARGIPKAVVAASGIEVGRTLYGSDFALSSIAPQGGTLFSLWTKIRAPLINGDGSWVAHAYDAQPTYFNTDVYVLKGTNWLVRGVVGNTNFNATSGKCWYNANTMFFGLAPGQLDPTGTYAGDYSSFAQNVGVAESVLRGWVWVAWQIVVDDLGKTVTLRQWLKFGVGGSVFLSGADTLSFSDLRNALKANGPSLWNSSVADAWTPSDAVSFQVGKDNGYLTRVRMEALASVPSLAKLEELATQAEPDALAWAWYPFDWEAGTAQLIDMSSHKRHLTLAQGGSLYQGPLGPF